MDLLPYAARLHRDLRAAAEMGGEEAVELADRLANGLEPSIRLVLLDALVEAAGHITADLAPGSVEVRLRGRDVDFVVASGTSGAFPRDTAGASAVTTVAAPDGEDEDVEEGGTARLSLRLPERLKPKVEQAAEAAGLSVNAWLVRSIGAFVDAPAPALFPTPPISSGQRHTGWAR